MIMRSGIGISPSSFAPERVALSHQNAFFCHKPMDFFVCTILGVAALGAAGLVETTETLVAGEGVLCNGAGALGTGS